MAGYETMCSPTSPYTHTHTQAQYISQCMTEIKKELKQENQSVKANAISKLTYVRLH